MASGALAFLFLAVEGTHERVEGGRNVRHVPGDAPFGNTAPQGGDAYPQWQQTIAARSVLPTGVYRPGSTASRIRCPLLAVISTSDQTCLPGQALKAARRAPRGEVVQVDGTHYAAFLDQHETVVTAELDFLRRHLLLDDPGPGEATPA